MTREEVFTSLMQGNIVHWSNEGYRVMTRSTETMDDMIVVFTSNQFTDRLTDGDLEQCFLGEEK